MADDILVDILKEWGNELMDRGMKLQTKVMEWVKLAQERINSLIEQKEQCLPTIVELKAGLLNDSPVDAASIAGDRDLMGKYVFAFYFLTVFVVSEFMGKMVGFIAFGWWLSLGTVYIFVFGIIPAFYLSLKWSPYPPSADDQRTYDWMLAGLIGVMHGYMVREYASISLLPICLVPLIQAASIRFLAPMAEGDRKKTIGIVCGPWLACYLIFGLLEGLGAAAIVYWSLVAVTSAVIFQLIMLRKEGKAPYLDDVANLLLLQSVVFYKAIVILTFLNPNNTEDPRLQLDFDDDDDYE